MYSGTSVKRPRGGESNTIDRRYQQFSARGQAAGAAALVIAIVRRVSGVPNRDTLWTLLKERPNRVLRARRSIPLYNLCQARREVRSLFICLLRCSDPCTTRLGVLSGYPTYKGEQVGFLSGWLVFLCGKLEKRCAYLLMDNLIHKRVRLLVFRQSFAKKVQ